MLYLNLCLRKQLKPVYNLVASLISLGLWQLKELFKVGLMNCKIFALKI